MDSGGGKIYSMHETLCTVVDRGVLGHRGAGGVCMCTGKTVRAMLFCFSYQVLVANQVRVLLQ